MTNTDFNYEKFVKYIHEHFEAEVSFQEVDEILSLEEDYTKDNPISLGKYLVLNRLTFSGKKLSGQEFYYDQKLNKGINIWIADNHKGKSTVFKIIKFALTGKDSIKPDIRSWIYEIQLEFNIGKGTYTCYIDRTGRDKGALYSFGIERFFELQENQKLDIIEREKEFEFKTNIQFQEKIQDFFFDHFSFYTLKYTSHKSAKDDLELSTGHLSWLTYFKSIYLESKNYEYLFFDKENMGGQGRKIFEMILGLPLTYPINMLGIQRDRVLEAIGKLRLTDKSKTETTQSKKDKIEKRLVEVTTILGELRKGGKLTFDEKPLIEEYIKIQEKVNENRKQQRIVNEAYQTEKNKQVQLQEELRNLEGDKSKIEAEINKLIKQELKVELYIQAESFFSNLEIKTCPHCEVEISENKKENERESLICSLCGEKSTQQKIEESELLEKIARIKDEKEGHSKKLLQIEKNIELHQEYVEKSERSIAKYLSDIIAIPSSDSDSKRLKEIEARIEEINSERKIQKEALDKKDDLMKEEAVLKFRLEEIEKQKSSDNSEEITKLSLKKNILEHALKALEKKRIKLNKNILNKLEQLILNEVHAFGIDSIKQIEINDKYDLVLTQNEVLVSFNELNEGEKLRVKLAFYLSLIQLDIEHNLGRHPRFLIFDSPGSEEMVPKHLHGLSNILKDVNKRFKDQLQIFVGSALREFSQITDPEKTFIKEEDEFVF